MRKSSESSASNMCRGLSEIVRINVLTNRRRIGFTLRPGTPVGRTGATDLAGRITSKESDCTVELFLFCLICVICIWNFVLPGSERVGKHLLRKYGANILAVCQKQLSGPRDF
jgi:hypothetical protein